MHECGSDMKQSNLPGITFKGITGFGDISFKINVRQSHDLNGIAHDLTDLAQLMLVIGGEKKSFYHIEMPNGPGLVKKNGFSGLIIGDLSLF